MTLRYIGSKSRLINQITNHIGSPKDDAFFVDAFCGTGVVAEAAASLGWNVRINDNLLSAVISASARLTTQKQASFKKLGGYENAIAKLNAAPPNKASSGVSTAPHPMISAVLKDGILRKKMPQKSMP